MDSIRVKVHKIHETHSENKEFVTSEIIKNIYLGKNLKHKMLLEIFQAYNDKIKRLMGKEFAPSTVERYKTSKKHVHAFINLEYNMEDIPVKDADHKFISGIEYYLKAEHKYAHNTVVNTSPTSKNNSYCLRK